MLSTVIDVILKYWVTAICGIAVAAISYVFNRYIKLEKEQRKRDQKAYYEKLTKDIIDNNKSITDDLTAKYAELTKKSSGHYTELTEKIADMIETENAKSEKDDAVLQAQIDNLKTEIGHIKNGLLSMQGKDFKEQCEQLLDNNHTITIDEWEEIDAAHEAYHGLGGNHRGDQLFALVSQKAENTLTKR